ncbi:MAG TPA: hypothetical protein VE783_06710 [Candidatus Limnocylindrales bacterium]|nr:hypothetical protein [Candidatus Limnocylindrales bacterium]
MSELLGSLVARSMGATQTFRPRTPSLFEPTPSTHPAGSPALRFRNNDAAPEEAELDFEGGEAIPRPQLNRTSSQPRQQPTENRNREHESSVREARSFRLDLTLDQRESGKQVSRPEEHAVPPPHAEPASAVTQMKPAIAVSHPAALRPERAEAHAPSRAESPFHMHPEKAHVEALVPEKQTQAPLSAFFARRISGEKEMKTPSLVPFMPERLRKTAEETAPAVPNSRRARQRDFSPAVSAPEPVVHVTIGRIEIRAEHQPSPGRRSDRASSAPVMGLEEYLRRKNRRGGE